MASSGIEGHHARTLDYLGDSGDRSYPFAQQSHLDTRHQIEQMVATFSERYNEQDAAAIASMFTKDAARVASAATAPRRGAINTRILGRVAYLQRASLPGASQMMKHGGCSSMTQGGGKWVRCPLW